VARHSVGGVFGVCGDGIAGTRKPSLLLHHAQCGGTAVSVLRADASDWKPVPLGVASGVHTASDERAVLGARTGVGDLPGDLHHQTAIGANSVGMGVVFVPGRVCSVHRGVVGAVNP